MNKDDELIQRFHTNDSVYSIPSSIIDSICFTPIPTIYKDETTNLDIDLRRYIIGSNDSTLFLSPQTPQKLIPSIGNQIATIECDDILPFGFLGKVEALTYQPDTIKVSCSNISLTDAFESLSIEAEFSTESTSNPTRADINIWPPKHFNFHKPTISGKTNLSNEIKIGEIFAQNYTMEGGFDLINDNTKINIAFLLTPRAFNLPEIYFSYTETSFNRLCFHGSFASSYNWNKEIPFQELDHIPLPGIPKIVELFEEIGMYLKMSGEIGLKGNYTLPFNTTVHLTANNTQSSIIPPTFRITPQPPESDTSIEGSATIGIGLYGKIGISAIDKNAASIANTIKLGADFSSSASLLSSKPTIESTNTDFYDDINKDDFYTVNLSASAEVSATVFQNKQLSGEISFGDLIFKNPILQWGCVPTFGDLILKPKANKASLTASANLDRNLLMPAKIGFGLYNKNQELVESWWHTTQYKTNNDISRVTHDFNNLNNNEEYTVHPIVEVGNTKMTANPFAKAVTSKQMYSVTNTYNTFEGNNYFGMYDLKLFNIGDDETIRVIINDSEKGWTTTNGKINVRRENNEEEYISLNKSNNKISFTYRIYNFDKFENEDYTNWIASNSESFGFYYKSSKDNYQSIKWYDIDFDVIYNHKPHISDWVVEYYPYLTSDVNKARGNIYHTISGSYWLKKITTNSIVYNYTYGSTRENTYDKKQIIGDAEKKYVNTLMTPTVWGEQGTKEDHNETHIFEWKDGTKYIWEISYTTIVDENNNHGILSVTYDKNSSFP